MVCASQCCMTSCFLTGTHRRNLPHDIAVKLEDARRNGDLVQHLSIGLDNDDWFLRTEGTYGTPCRA